MKEKILEDLKSAMKSQDKEKLSVIRAISLEEINKKIELSDDDIIAIIAKQIKTRKESIVDFEKGNRQDLVEQTKREIEILNQYMPQQFSEEEISNILNEIFDQVQPKGISDMGKVMKEASSRFKGRADMSSVSQMIKDRLNNC